MAEKLPAARAYYRLMQFRLFLVAMVLPLFFTLQTFGQSSTPGGRMIMIYGSYRIAIEDTLNANLLAAPNNYMSRDDIKTSVQNALAAETKNLKDDRRFSTDEIDSVSGLISSALQKNLRDLQGTIDTNKNKSIVQGCVISLLGEITLANQNPPAAASVNFGSRYLSDYRFMLGGAWIHTADGGATKGDFTAEMFARTRWFDGRKGKILRSGGKPDTINSMEDIPNEHTFDQNGDYRETSFLDLLIDAQFITNQPFNKTVLDSTKASSGQLFLQSAASSNLSLGLFWVPLDWRLFDHAALGPFARFELSTRENNADIFRRIIFGARIENRANSILNGANIELGFTPDRTAGSLDSTKTIIGVDRIMLNVELPMREKDGTIGLYV